MYENRGKYLIIYSDACNYYIIDMSKRNYGIFN